jgi:Flp pilus assembly protein TadG
MYSNNGRVYFKYSVGNIAMMRVLGMAISVLFGPMRDRRGGVATFLAATIVPLVAFCGLAVDTSRGYLMKSRLSYALDSAALAGGRVMYDETLRDETINKFFEANFPANYMGASIGALDIEIDDSQNTIKISTVANLGTSLMSVLGFSKMDVAGTTEVKLSSLNIEVAVVLDVTGSMDGSKIADLKSAAADLVDIIVNDQQDPYYSRVALIPYSMGVNVGSYADQIRGSTGGVKTITGATRANPIVITAPNHGFSDGDKVFIADINGMTQVNNTYYYNSSTYAPPRYTVKNPTTNTFQLYSSGGGSSINGTGYSSYTSGGTVGKVCSSPGCEYYYFKNSNGSWRTQRTTTCVSERVGAEAFTDVAPSTAPMAHNYTNYPYASPLPTWSSSAGGNGSSAYNHPCLTSQIVPLTSDKSLLTTKIDAMSAAGATAGQIGVAWGWYMVSPNFGYLWPDDENKPADYGTAELQKAVVIMTDGEFNTIYSDGVIAKNSGSGSGGSNYKIDQNGDNGLDAFQQAQLICSAMKTQNIEVYTIGFDIGGSTTIQNFLTNCATDASHAYVAEDGDQLKNVFHTIAVNISQLRLYK